MPSEGLDQLAEDPAAELHLTRARRHSLVRLGAWANPDWGSQLGYSPADLARVNRDAITMLARRRDGYGLADVVISGMIGPRGDGYSPGEEPVPDEAADYHAPQVEALARAGADIVSAYTLTSVGEATGIVRAARAAGVPALAIVGGCCGTDARHVSALWN